MERSSSHFLSHEELSVQVNYLDIFLKNMILNDCLNFDALMNEEYQNQLEFDYCIDLFIFIQIFI